VLPNNAPLALQALGPDNKFNWIFCNLLSGNKMLTNELKKGTRVQLRNGWYATIKDNARGNTRLCEVEGFYTEMGSVWSWDIEYVITGGGGKDSVEHTEAQRKLRHAVAALGF
jgi:hypothetical protein